MKVVIDFGLCQSHAVCTKEAPEIFAMDENTDQLIVKLENPSEGLRAKLEKAKKFCPNRAISIQE